MGGDFGKFCGLLRIYELSPKYRGSWLNWASFYKINPWKNIRYATCMYTHMKTHPSNIVNLRKMWYDEVYWHLVLKFGFLPFVYDIDILVLWVQFRHYALIASHLCSILLLIYFRIQYLMERLFLTLPPWILSGD